MAQSAPFLTAQWRYLAMLNYEVDPAVLRPHVPRGTELDTYENMTLVSVVGFRFLSTKLRGLAIPFHRDFDEVNLRFYVRRKGPEGWRRGVAFIKEIVPRRAIAWVARRLYNESYVALPMRHRVELEEGDASGIVFYEWKYGGRWNSLKATVSGEAARVVSGSEPEFITEHYWGYSRQRNGGTLEYRVEHPRWRVWPVERSDLSCAVGDLYGQEFVDGLSGAARSAFVADGSAVAVHAGIRIPI